MSGGRLHWVTGKGGVGKSTVAAAIALGLARSGQRVLAIELGPPAGLHRILQLPPTPSGATALAPSGVMWASFDGEAALAEYLRRRLRLGPALELVLGHPLYRAFVGAAPGLRELMAVGKVRDELRAKERWRRRWDAIVIDAGASGRALEHLRMPAVAARTFRSGLVHREASRIEALLSDPRRCALHVVALAEPMPVVEAQEIVERARELRLPIGRLILNACREAAPVGTEAALARLTGGGGEAESRGLARRELARVARQRLGWLSIQERSIAQLEGALGLEALRLPRLAPPLGERALATLADHFEAEP